MRRFLPAPIRTIPLVLALMISMLAVQPARRDEPALAIPAKPPQARISAFDQLVSEWMSLTYVLNNLTRGLGLADAYPFVLCEPVIDKLRFVCHTMGLGKERQSRAGGSNPIDAVKIAT